MKAKKEMSMFRKSRYGNIDIYEVNYISILESKINCEGGNSYKMVIMCLNK